MSLDNLPDELGNALGEDDGYHDRVIGEYHPSSLSGCPLGTFLDFMLEKEVDINNHIFNGTAVHYYLQESGKLDTALHRAGFNVLDTEYEVGKRHTVDGGIVITGRADCITYDGDEKSVIDIKYTSLKPEYNNGRLMKYATQVNMYANMFNCDKWCLLLVYSRADDITEEISIISGETDKDNWEMAKDKARNIHDALLAAGYDDGVRWTKDQLEERGMDFWEEIMDHFEEDRVPAYPEELKYSDRDEWVLPYTDEWKAKDGGISSFLGGA